MKPSQGSLLNVWVQGAVIIIHFSLLIGTGNWWYLLTTSGFYALFWFFVRRCERERAKEWWAELTAKTVRQYPLPKCLGYCTNVDAYEMKLDFTGKFLCWQCSLCGVRSYRR